MAAVAVEDGEAAVAGAGAGAVVEEDLADSAAVADSGAAVAGRAGDENSEP